MKAFGRRGVLLFAISAVSVLGTAGTASAASISTTDLDFGNQNIGTTSAPQVLNVAQEFDEVCIPGLGCFPVPDFVSGISVTGPFAQTNTCIPFAPCTITVTHVPTAAGPSVGTLTADGDTVNLRGTGVDPNAMGAGAGAGDVVKEGQVSNLFSFGKVELNKENGTAKLTVDVPGPGNLTLGGPGVVKKRVGGGATASKAVPAAGKVTLLIKAKGAKKQKLNDTGKVTVKPKITYTPTGGVAKTQTKSVTLKKNL
jgi:hypothetical protein